jgi:hypothetical protein
VRSRAKIEGRQTAASHMKGARLAGSG